MSLWYLAKDGDVLIHNNKGLTISDRIPYIDIQCPQGFDPEAEGCGKSYGHWSLIDSAMNVWRFECKYSTWHDLFYNNRSIGSGDFKHTDGDFRCVGSGNTDLVIQMDGLFRNCDGLVSCATIDTQNCINLSAMFAECRYLTEVPYLNTSSNLDFNNFVVSCERLTKINEDIDTSNGRCFWWMCYGCFELQTVPTIDLRNANDTWQSEFSRRGGNDHMFTFCPSLKYVHLIGGAGISNVSAMFYMQYYESDKPTKVLTIDWDDCYLPLVTGLGTDGDGNPTAPMFERIYSSYRPDATYYSVSSISLPNIAQNVAGDYVPQAVHLGDIYVPNVYTNVYFNNDLESIGTITLTPSVISYGFSQFSSMFEGCTKLTEFPNVVMPTIAHGAISAPSLYRMFYGMTNVGAGSYAFYQDLISKGYGSTDHYQTFTNCGINTPEGAADLAQIPSAWK